MQNADLYIMVYDLPLDFHANAQPAAIAVRCAAAQGNPLTFIQNMILLDPTVGKSVEAAQSLTINMDKFNACLVAEKDAPAASAAVVSKLGITGTPSTIINGRMYSGLVDWDTLSKFIEQSKGK